jgi:hypothetical protein
LIRLIDKLFCKCSYSICLERFGFH